MNIETIAAISTPAGTGGIGIIRISGPRSVEILTSVFKQTPGEKAGPGKTVKFESHRLYHGFIHDGKRDVDEVMVVVMKAPRSYTREDVVEIQSHSSLVVLNTILSLVLSRGALSAEPGEFTKRAFLNGRIDLTQAEAVIDIINTKSEESLNYSMAQSEGALRDFIESVKDDLVLIMTRMEAAIDFPEDVEELFDWDSFSRDIEDKIQAPARDLISKYEETRYVKEGIRIAIVGAPNAGKSSLMNGLTEEERSIVTDIPGTTRDLVQGEITLDGFIVSLTDTAGIHETSDVIESMGIERSRSAMEKADVTLLVVDNEKGMSESDVDLLNSLRESNHIVVFNKCDLVSGIDDETTKLLGDSPHVFISARDRRGLKELKKRVKGLIITEFPEGKDYIAPNLRHKGLLEKITERCESLLSAARSEMTPDLLMIDLNDILEDLNRIIGASGNEEILDSIFSNFCIGK